MVGRIDFDITGAAEMEKLLLELGDIVAGKVGDAAVRAGLKTIQKEAKRLVPKRTRALEKSITVKIEKRRRRDNERVGFIGFRPPVSRRAHLTEFGNRNSAAHPFMRPAMDAKAGDALDAMGEEMAKAIEREALKLANE